MEDFFDYSGVQQCQKDLDVKFSEFASLLKDANDYMNDNIDVSHDSAIFGELGKKVLAEWNANAATFSDFYENFRQWSVLMGSILDSYKNFEIGAVKDAFAANQSDGSGLRGVQEYREALRFNQDEADKKIMYDQMKVQQINPKTLASLNWSRGMVENFGQMDSKKVAEVETKIANGDTIFDTDGNPVNKLVLKPELMEDNCENEFLIYEGMDKDGKISYYCVQNDGQLCKLNKDDVKTVGTVKDNLKVGDHYYTCNDLNGDDAKERIYKASYIVGYNKGNNETIMALPRSNGTVEYYAVKGEVKTGVRADCEITKVGLSSSDVTNAGLKPLYEEQTFAANKDTAAIKEKNEFNNINQ